MRKTDFDCFLSWPFPYKIKFEIFNYVGKVFNLLGEVVSNESDDVFKEPGDKVEDPAFCHSTFKIGDDFTKSPFFDRERKQTVLRLTLEKMHIEPAFQGGEIKAQQEIGED